MSQSSKKGVDWSITGSRGESILEHFWSRKQWDYSKFISLVLATLAIAIPVFVIYRGYFANMNTRDERSLMIALLLLFVFLKFPLGKRKWSEHPGWLFLIDIIIILIVIANEVYILWGQGVQDTRNIYVNVFGQSVRGDYIMALSLLILILEATRRSFGWIMVMVPTAFIIYSLTADLWPGLLLGARADLPYLAGMLYLEDAGIFGIGISILLSMMFLFLLFGSLMMDTRVSAFLTSLANAAVGHYSGGPAKVAVFASAAFGSLSGSGIANVATTGAATIPMMKRTGYSPTFAAAVESCASIGGYFTPPVMGSAAFLIAVFTNTPYLMVCLYALVPALLYFLSIFIQVHLRAQKTNLAGLPRDACPSKKRVLLEGGHLIFPVFVLIIGLVMGYSITRVAILGIFSIILISFFSPHTRKNPRGILIMFERATSAAIGISLVVVVAGIIQGTASVSGLGMKLSMLVETLSAGNLILGLIVAGIALVIMSMGISPLLCYYMGYIFMIPALISVGAPEMPIHLFVLIFGGIAGITPPVCITAYTAATIAGAPAMRTGFTAMKLGFVAYVVCFLLVLHPALLFMGGASLVESVLSLVAAAAGIGCISIVAEGWLLKRVAIWERILFFIAGLGLIAPPLSLRTAAGFGLAALVAARHWLATRQSLVRKV